MDNKRAREIIRDYEINGCGICHQGNEHEIIEAFNVAIKSLEDDWIAVEDRLPEEEKFVLVTINSDASIKKVTIGYVTMARDDNDVLYGEWFDELFCEIDGVVAWKPLPEPYSKSKAFIKNVAEPFSKGIQDGLKGSGKNVE